MRLLERLKERRRRKAHARYVAERDWQERLAQRDTTATMHDLANTGNVVGQAGAPGQGV